MWTVIQRPSGSTILLSVSVAFLLATIWLAVAVS
jgi:hypothetical protein